MFRILLIAAIGLMLNLSGADTASTAGYLAQYANAFRLTEHNGNIVFIKGGKPLRPLKQKFNTAAKPKMSKGAGRQRNNKLGNRNIRGKLTASRVRGVHFPKKIKRIAVSPLAPKKLSVSSRAIAKTLAKSPLTPQHKNATLNKIRQKAVQYRQRSTKSLNTKALKKLYDHVDKRFIKASDGYSIRGHIKNDNRAWVRAEVRNQHVNITDVHRGNLPAKSAGALIAKTLTAHKVSFNKITISRIKEPKTLSQYKSGVPASKSRLGRTITNALSLMGKQPKEISYRMNRNKLELDVRF